MTERTLRIVMNGVTGRMGMRQHLLRSILPLRESGTELPGGERVRIEPVLVGRNRAKLAELAERHGIAEWTDSLDDALADPSIDVYFDAPVTTQRVAALKAAIAAGKHLYTEKPVASTLDEALELGGGIVLDMFPHWCYVLDGLVGPVRSKCRSTAPKGRRWPASGRVSPSTA